MRQKVKSRRDPEGEHMLKKLILRLRSLLCDGMGEGWNCLIAWLFIALLLLLPLRYIQ